MRRGWLAGRDPHGVEVELLDGPSPTDEVPSASGPDGAPHAAPAVVDVAAPDLSGRRRRRLLLLSVVALAVVAVVAANVVEARTRADQAAAFAALPSSVPGLSDPMAEQWRLTGVWSAGDVEGTLLVSEAEGGFLAVDPVTGATLWRLADPTAALMAEFCRAYPWREPVGRALTAVDPVDALLLCVAPGATDGASSMVLRVLEPGTGAERYTTTFSDQLFGLEVVDGGLLALSVTPDGYLAVSRRHPQTGAELWTYTSTEPGSMQPPYVVADDRVLVHGPVPVVLSLDSGEPVGDLMEEGARPALLEQSKTSLPDGGVATWRSLASGAGAGEVTDADGTVRYDLPGQVLLPAVGDPTGREVLVVGIAGGGIAGLDVRTGEELWASPTPARAIVAAAGVLVTLVGTEEVVALSLVDGTTLWRAPVDPAVQVDGVTDGEVVLTARREGQGSSLVALDLADGSAVWRAPLPGTAYQVRSVGRHVVVVTQDGLVGLG